jgi:hypothetical protein
MNDPSPAQYYTVDGKTISRNDPNLAISRIYNQNKPYLYDQSLVIKGNTVSSTGSTYASRLFEFSDGSDWEQMNSLVLPDQDFIEVDAASVEEVNNLTFATMDLYTITERDLILLKNQSSTNAITNGFYRYIDGEFVKELPYVQDGSQTLGIKINNGSLNKNNRYLLFVCLISAQNTQKKSDWGYLISRMGFAMLLIEVLVKKFENTVLDQHFDYNIPNKK